MTADFQPKKRRFSWRIFLCALLVLNNFVIILNNFHAKADNNVVITFPGIGQTLTDANPTITGTAPPNKNINIKLDNSYVGIVQSDNNGNWAYQVHDLTNAPHSVQASITDGTAIFGSQKAQFQLAKTSINKPSLAQTTTTDAKISSPFKTVFSADSSRAYVADQQSNKINVIDTSSKSILASIALDGQPIDIALSDSRGKLYVALANMNKVDVINTANLSASITSFTVAQPITKLVLSSDNTNFYAICGNYSTICYGALDQDSGTSLDSPLNQPYNYPIIYQLIEVSPGQVVVGANARNIYGSHVVGVTIPTGNSTATITTSGVAWNPGGVSNLDSGPVSLVTVNGTPMIAIANPQSGGVTFYLASDMSYYYYLGGIGAGTYEMRTIGSELYIYSDALHKITKIRLGNFAVLGQSPTLPSGNGAFTGMRVASVNGSTKVYVSSSANPPNSPNAKVEVYDPTSNTVTSTIQLSSEYGVYPFIQPDSQQLWLDSIYASSINVVSTHDDTISSKIYNSPNAGNILVASPDGSVVYTNGATPYDFGRIRKLNANTGAELGQVQIGRNQSADFKLSRDGTKIVAYNNTDRSFTIINTANMNTVGNFPQNYDCTKDYDINQDASKIYCGDGTGSVIVYDTAGNTIANYTVAGPLYGQPRVLVSADGRYLYLSDTLNLYKYDTSNGSVQSSPIDTLVRQGNPSDYTVQNMMVLNPTGSKLYLGGGPKIEVFDVAGPTLTRTALMDGSPSSPRHDLSFSHDGKRAFMAYAVPVNGHDGIGYTEFDTQDDLYMGNITLETTPLTGGTITLLPDTAVVESTTVSFNVNQPVIFDADSNISGFVINIPGAVALPVKYDHGPLSVSLVSGSLPPGVTLGMCNYDVAMPCLNGTATTAATYQFTANISDGITNSNKDFTLVVDKGGRFVNPNNDFSLQLPSAVLGQSYSATLELTGPPSQVSDVIIGLPVGMYWTQDQNDLSKVIVSGTVDPSNSLGRKCFVLTAFDGYNHNNQEICVNVVATPLSITTTSLPDGTFASSYSQTIATTGGDGSKHFSISSGNLPPGLNLDSTTGTISGTPSDHSSYSFTITATDLTGSTSQNYTLNIQSGNNPNATITTTSLHAGQINMPYNGQGPQTKIESAGFNNLQSWSVTTGDLPTGMTLTSQGSSALIDGTPTASGNFTFTVATDDGVNNQVKQFTIAIRPTPPPPTKTKVVITSPADGASLGGGDQLVTGTVSPAGAIVQVSIDGQAPYDVPSDATGQWSFSADGLSSGAHNFTASVKQPAREYAYIASSYFDNSSITIIDTKTDNIVGQLTLPRDLLQLAPSEKAGAGTVFADPSGKLAYVGGAIIDQNDQPTSSYVLELDTTTNSFTRMLKIPGVPYSGSFDWPHRTAYSMMVNTNGERSINAIDLNTMQIKRQKTDPNLGGFNQNFSYTKSALNSDGSKLFLPNAGGSFINVINTTDLTITKVEVGFASFEIAPINNQYVVLPALASLTPNPPVALLNNDGTLAQQTNTNTQGSSVIVRYWLSSRDGQSMFDRVTISGDQSVSYNILLQNPILDSVQASLGSQPLAVVGTQDWGMGMAQTHDGKKVYLINTADGGWGSVDVFDTTTNRILVGTKYPIPASLSTYSPGEDWISAVPATTFSTSRNITVSGGVDIGNSTVDLNDAYNNFIRYIKLNWPNVDISVIKPFDIPGFDFHNKFKMPKISPVNGWGNDQNVSKTNAGLVGNIIGALKTGVSLVPTQIALTFPYLMLLVLIIMILSLLAQTRDELDKARRIKHIIAKRKSLEEERNNFIGLISHYLNTPISMMQGGVDLIATLQRAPRSMTDSLQKTLQTLSQKVKSLLTSTAQTSTDRPDKTKLPRMIKPYKSFVVMAPVVLVGIMTALTNWLLNSAGVADLSVINIFTQIMAFALLLQALFATYKYHQTAKQNLATAQASLDRETTMASARLHFLSGSVDELKTEIAGLKHNLPGLAAAPNAKAVKDGYARLQSILGRLQLLTEIEQDQHRGEITSFNLHRSINNVLSQYQPQLATRGITVDTKVPKTLAIKQDRQMLELVISSLIDNAIKFVPKRDGAITIKASVVRGKIKLTITDNGAGINKNKINQLFKPFSRAETALRFNYEGLGLSLYLDKVIIEKLGGTIAISSHKGEGTEVTLTLNPSQKTTKARK